MSMPNLPTCAITHPNRICNLPQEKLKRAGNFSFLPALFLLPTIRPE